MVDSFKVACVGWSSRQDGPIARPRVLGATVVPWIIDHAMRGEGLRASRSSNLFATLTVLLGCDAEAALRARRRHRSSVIFLV